MNTSMSLVPTTAPTSSAHGFAKVNKASDHSEQRPGRGPDPRTEAGAGAAHEAGTARTEQTDTSTPTDQSTSDPTATPTDPDFAALLASLVAAPSAAAPAVPGVTAQPGADGPAAKSDLKSVKPTAAVPTPAAVAATVAVPAMPGRGPSPTATATAAPTPAPPSPVGGPVVTAATTPATSEIAAVATSHPSAQPTGPAAAEPARSAPGTPTIAATPAHKPPPDEQSDSAGDQSGQASPGPAAAPAGAAQPAASTNPATAMAPITAPTPSSDSTAASRPLSPITTQVIPEVTRLVSQGDGVHRITLQLQPAALGDVRVVLTVRGGDVRVSLAAHADARTALLNDSAALHRMLVSTGADQTRIVVRDLAGTQPGTVAPPTSGAQAGPDTGSGQPGSFSPGNQNSPGYGNPGEQQARTPGHTSAMDGRSGNGDQPGSRRQIDQDTATPPRGVDVTM